MDEIYVILSLKFERIHISSSLSSDSTMTPTSSFPQVSFHVEWCFKTLWDHKIPPLS